MRHGSWETHDQSSTHPEMAPTIDQSKDTTTVWLGETIIFIRATDRTTNERVTYRSRNFSKTAASQKPSPAWAQLTKAENLECTAISNGHSTDWRVSFLHISIGLSFFQATWVIWEALQVVLTAYISLWMEGPCKLCQFQGLPGTFELFTSWV